MICMWVLFFFKQKTAYEMRMSDWSSDVCSSDLRGWMFGVGHFSVNDNCIQHAFTYQDKMPHWLGYAAPIALALYRAVYPAIAAGLAWKFASARAVGNATAHPDARFALVAGAAWIATRSAGRRVGKGCDSTCISRWPPYH